MLVGFAACAVVVIVDLTSDSLVLIPLLVLAPLIACSGGSERGTLAVALVASIMSVPMGWIDHIGGSRR
ncbi:MAG: hypothetical protein QOE00_1234, partial [Ilumatobacteraceae bacterium]